MTGPLAEVDLAILVSFTLGALIATWSIVVIAGFLPVRLGNNASDARRTAVIFSAGLMISALVALLCMTVPLLPTAVAIVAAGLAILAGPFLVQPIPERLRDSELAPVVVIVASLTALALLPNPF